jgi:hypothetical protein
MNLLVRRSGHESAIECRHTLVEFANPAFQVANYAKRIEARWEWSTHGFALQFILA